MGLVTMLLTSGAAVSSFINHRRMLLCAVCVYLCVPKVYLRSHDATYTRGRAGDTMSHRNNCARLSFSSLATLFALRSFFG